MLLISGTMAFCVGYYLSIDFDTTKKTILASFIFVTAVYLLTQYSFFYGVESAKELCKFRKDKESQKGMSSTKISQFPIIDFVSQTKLLTKQNPANENGSYFYSTTDSSFFRELMYAENSLYIIENYKDTITILNISKEQIKQIRYNK
jgi:hypothetical protein